MATTRKTLVRPEAVSAEESVLVTATAAGLDNKIETKRIRKFVTEPAYVRVGNGVTKNLGNYESLRLDVSISMPCYREEVDAVFTKLSEQVGKMLDTEISKFSEE